MSPDNRLNSPYRDVEIEAWLAANTIQCAMGRLTPAQCKALRSRPSYKSLIKAAKSQVTKKNFKQVNEFRPLACENCTDWEEKTMALKNAKKAHEPSKDTPKEDLEGTKKCSACGKVKPLGEFYKNKRRPDGLEARCKDCVRQGRLGRKANCLTIDFTGYEELLERLERAAEEEVRTAQQQTIYYIKYGLSLTRRPRTAKEA